MKKCFFIVLLAVLVLFRTDAQAGVVKPYKTRYAEAKAIAKKEAIKEAEEANKEREEWDTYEYTWEDFYYDPYVSSDVWCINEELEETGKATLVSGATYDIDSYIRIGDHMTLDATGATLKVGGNAAMRNDWTTLKKGYDSMSDIKVKGGTWLSRSSSGYWSTSFSFSHAKNITFENMTIKTTNAKGHSIELVGCKNVTIKNCKVYALGKPSSGCLEEQIQLDVAASNTAPFLSGYLKDGTTCKNITIDHCTVTGARAVCANYTKKDGRYKNKYHDNIVVKNCTLTGLTSEALSFFNANNVTVRNNTIITKSKRTGTAYSIGCHMAIFGTKKVSAYEKGKFIVEKNTIKGGRQGFQMCSHTKSRYGKLTIKNNKLYCKKGKGNALKVTTNASGQRSAKKVTKKGNKLYKW